MKLEDQVPQLKYCQRLKELGAKQESLFRWIEFNRGDWVLHGKKDVKSYGWEESWGDEEFWKTGIAAPTVTELGEMLPWRIEIEKENRFYILEWEKGGKPWHWINYTHRDGGVFDVLKTEEAATEADARAQMLIYLKENSLI